jgi:hypothetical protein
VAAQLGGQAFGVGRELAPGDAEDAVAVGLEVAVSGAIFFERFAGGVDRVAVELDDQALGGPEGVGVVGPAGLVRFRSWERVGVEEVEEGLLEVASDDGLAGRSLMREGAFEVVDPRRCGWRAMSASRGSGLARRRISASLRACRSCWAFTTAARSKRVRAGLVTRMPFSTATSSGGSTR